MSTYLLINLLIISVPLIMSFESKVKFYRKIPSVILTILAGALLFVTWDIYATARGDWSFNPEHVSNIAVLGLPLEELLFFVTVPYSILFIYECVIAYTSERFFTVSRAAMVFILLVLTGLAYVFRYKDYTMTVLLVCVFILSVVMIASGNFVISKSQLLTLVISFVPFLIVNYILTSLPIVIYSDDAITGIRFLTIPAEDFFYMFSMVATWLAVYNLIGTRKRTADDQGIAQQVL